MRIITDEKSDVSLVLRTALFHGISGQWHLYKIVGGEAQLTGVQVGLMNDFESEIVAGANDGDIVIIASESSVMNGGRVVIMEQTI